MISADAGAHLREKNYPQLRRRPLTSIPPNPIRRDENGNSGNKNRRQCSHEAATLRVGPRPSQYSSAAKASLSRSSESPRGRLTLSRHKGAIVTQHPRKPLTRKTNSGSKGIGSGALLTPLPQITSDEHSANVADTIHCNSEKAHGFADKQVLDSKCEMIVSQEIEALLMKVVKELSVAREISYCGNTSVDIPIGALGIDDHGRHVSCSSEECKPYLRMCSNDNDRPIHSLAKDVTDKRATTTECTKAAKDAKIKHQSLLDDDESLGTYLFMGDGRKSIYKLSIVEVSEILSEATNVSADDNELKPKFCGKANDEKCCPESPYTVSSCISSHLSIATCHDKKISIAEERFSSEISSKTPKSGNRSRKEKLTTHPTRNVSSIQRANSSASNVIRTQAATRKNQQKRSREKKADKMLKNHFGMEKNEELKNSLKVNHENLSAISQKTARSECCSRAGDEECLNEKNITESVPRDAKKIPISDLKKCGDNQMGENDSTTLNLNSMFIETKGNPNLKDILQLPPKERNLLSSTSQSKLTSENCIVHRDETLHPVTADIPDDNLSVMKESSFPSVGKINGDSIDCNDSIASFPECHDSGRAGSSKMSRNADVMPVMLPGCRRHVGLSEMSSIDGIDADVMPPRPSRGGERSEEESATALEPKERGTFILSFSNLPSHRLPVIKIKSRFEEQFKLFAKFKNFRNTGVIISRLNSCRWLKQAKVTDHRLTTSEAGTLFRKVAMTKLALNIHDFESYLVLVAERKKTDWKIIKRQLPDL